MEDEETGLQPLVTSTDKVHFISHYCSKSLFFVQKFNFHFPGKIVELFWVKTREKAAVLDFLAVDNFDFTRKNKKKNLGQKVVKMLGDLHFLVVDNFDFQRKIVEFCQH